MKDKFPGYFKKTDNEIKEVWQNCAFVFDANILLNLYRYSDSTREDFLGILDKIKGRIWIPNRAVEEYLSNRVSEIASQSESYLKAKKCIEDLQGLLDNSKRHPFIDEVVRKESENVFSKLKEELKDNEEKINKRIVDDEIKEKVAEVFDQKVGDPYSEEQLRDIFSIGQGRYDKKIPPGYKDASKGGDDPEDIVQQSRKFGDYIVWRQLLDFASEKAVDIVFVTDDKKEDWWDKHSNKTIGARPELVREFREQVGAEFYMYQASQFLEFARESLGENVSEEMVQEIKDISNFIGPEKEVDQSLHAENSIKRIKHLSSQIRKIRLREKELKDSYNKYAEYKKILTENNGFDFESGDMHEGYNRAKVLIDGVNNRIADIEQALNECSNDKSLLNGEISHRFYNLKDYADYLSLSDILGSRDEGDDFISNSSSS